jgi:BMFP domain-containing protein YqiC
MTTTDPDALADEFTQIMRQAFKEHQACATQLEPLLGDTVDPWELNSLLPEPVRVILDVGLMDTEIQNGGIDQWIWNPGAERFAETCDALNTIGAQQVRHILDEVRNLFPSQAVPHSRRLRDYFRRINPTMQEEFERLSIVYFDLFESPADNLYQLLVDYWHHSR